MKVICALLLAGAMACAAETITILAEPRHLGFAEEPEWRELEGKTPQGRTLNLIFSAHANDTPATLYIAQQDVKLRWPVLLNGKRLTFLETNEASLVSAYEVPARALGEGENTLSILSPNAPDDIFVGPITLDPRARAEAAGEAALSVRVTEKGTNAPLPCRITIVDSEGRLAALMAKPEPAVAHRSGVAYTGAGRAELMLRAGRYTVYATRGPEYGVDSREVLLAAGQTAEVALEIAREVPTPGLVACDTHVHTFTLSKHGDATMEERMLTLGGEGVELPIATDHNVYADYGDAPQRMGVAKHFTWVTGDEVTTSVGHFNTFPIADRSAPHPDVKLTSWPELITAMRGLPGNRVVVLNHPRDIHNNFIPFEPRNFNAVTGENLRGPEFTFDAIEVCNSGTLQSDFMRSFRDWFALLNYGYRITAVGSSDSHDVSRFNVGQGRTLVVCDDSDPGKIDVEAACRSLNAGRAYVSMGLLTLITVNGSGTPGDVVRGLDSKVPVHVQVFGPSWIQADLVELFANGVKIREAAIAPAARAGKLSITWDLPRPPHDVHLVAIASGPGVTAPYWKIPSPYQPVGRIRQPRVIGATNPVWLDADGDNNFTAARTYARALVEKHGAEPPRLIEALATHDEAVAAQAAGFCHARGLDVQEVLAKTPAGSAALRGFDAFLETIQK